MSDPRPDASPDPGAVPPPPPVPSGWYVDGSQPDALRYWDGSAWTDQWAPRPAGDATATLASSPPAATPPATGGEAAVAAAAATVAASAAPGWYPDPDQPGYQRYRDENGWTSRTVLADAGASADVRPLTVSRFPVSGTTTPTTHTSGVAIAAFVCSLLGLWIAGIPLGYTARSEIDGSGGRIGGRGYATAGIVLGWIGLVATIILVIVIVSAANDATSVSDPGYEMVPCSDYPDAIGC